MKIKTILYFIIILNSFALFSCAQESDIAALNNRLDELGDIVEQHKKNKINDFLAKDFATTKFSNKAKFLLFIRYQLRRNKNISIVIADKDVIKNNTDFDVTFRILLVGSNSFLPERGQMYSVASRWIKEDGRWVISRLRWEKFNANE